uniref:Uncharacterized protein n=1 Tax=Arundo donax TaxID=35708 RepID=A0A0A8YWM3_ARUDO
MIDEMIMGSIVGCGAVRPLWSVKRIIGESNRSVHYMSPCGVEG